MARSRRPSACFVFGCRMTRAISLAEITFRGRCRQRRGAEAVQRDCGEYGQRVASTGTKHTAELILRSVKPVPRESRSASCRRNGGIHTSFAREIFSSTTTMFCWNDRNNIMNTEWGSNGPFNPSQSQQLQNTFNRPGEIDKGISCHQKSNACAAPPLRTDNQ
jgi:hypothetical protein